MATRPLLPKHPPAVKGPALNPAGEIASRRYPAWVSVVQYVLRRTREPTTVHRAVQTVLGISAGWALTGPERYVALIVGISGLIGILMPDRLDTPPPPDPFTSSGWGDK